MGEADSNWHPIGCYGVSLDLEDNVAAKGSGNIALCMPCDGGPADVYRPQAEPGRSPEHLATPGKCPSP